MLIGDNSVATANLGAGADNVFGARFAGGYYLYSNSALTVGAVLGPGANSWGTLSDSTKKENIVEADGEATLRAFRTMRLGSWNYRCQDPKSPRHYGPMAQEWFSAFGRDAWGVIGTDTTLASADVDGVAYIAIKALEQRTTELQAKSEEIATLKNEVHSLKIEHARMAAQLDEIGELRTQLASLKSLLLRQKESNHDQALLAPGK